MEIEFLEEIHKIIFYDKLWLDTDITLMLKN